MARRPAKNVTNIRGTGEVDANEVWRVLECAAPGCDHLHRVSEDSDGFPDVTATCPKCGHKTGRGHILRAPRWKYCRVCEWLQPIGQTASRSGTARGKAIGSAFHYHKPKGRSFRSERQLECKECKKEINRVLNPLRTSDQHRESAQSRRMYAILAGQVGKLNSEKVFRKFDGRCFKCGKEMAFRSRGPKEFEIDHTLPIRLLWPVATDNATLLCKQHNAEKSDGWPSEFYSKEQLQRLSVLTGIPFQTLSGPPAINQEAVDIIRANVDTFLSENIRHPREIRRVRELIRSEAGIDIKDHALNWPSFLDDRD